MTKQEKENYKNLYTEKYDEIEKITKEVLKEMYLYGGANSSWAKDIYLCTDGEIYVTSEYSLPGYTVVENAIKVTTIESWNVENDSSFLELENYDNSDIEQLKKEGIFEYDEYNEVWCAVKPIPFWAIEYTDVIDWLLTDEYNNNSNPLLPESLFEEK